MGLSWGVVLSSEAGLRCYLWGSQWHGGLEGSGDGVSSPRPQTDHFPRHCVQLLVRQPPLLACNKHSAHVSLSGYDRKGEWGLVHITETMYNLCKVEVSLKDFIKQRQENLLFSVQWRRPHIHIKYFKQVFLHLCSNKFPYTSTVYLNFCPNEKERKEKEKKLSAVMSMPNPQMGELQLEVQMIPVQNLQRRRRWLCCDSAGLCNDHGVTF